MLGLILAHTLISLVGLFAGFIVIGGMFASDRLERWTAVFFFSTILTSVSGFFLPAEKFLPSHAVAIVSLVLLPIALFARYFAGMRGAWRWTFVVTAVLAQYLNVFVLLAQLFLRVPALNKLAPTGAEPPFVFTQALVLITFIAVTFLAGLAFRPPGIPSTQASF